MFLNMSKQWSVSIAYGSKSVMGFERVGKGVLFLYPAPSVFVSSNLCRGVFKDDQREGQGGGGST